MFCLCCCLGYICIGFIVVICLLVLLVGRLSSYGVLLEEPETPPLTDLPRHCSKALPRLQNVFVGRDAEMEELIKLLSFNNSKTQIVGIFGGPGFGKSTLALQAGHRLSASNITVEYYDLSEVSFVPYLLHRILGGLSNITKHHEMLEEVKCWAETTQYQKIMLFDGCDKLFSGNQKNELQKIIELFTRHSVLIKVLFTSRHVVSFLSDFKAVKLEELSTKQAVILLKTLNLKISDEDASQIAQAVGNIPLGLQIVGALLETGMSSSAIIFALSSNPIKTLSSDTLPIDKQVITSLQLSYDNLDEFTQRCGRYLANFPGSFSKDAAIGVIQYMVNTSYWYVEVIYEFNIFLHWLPNPSTCLATLTHRSLLKSHSNTQRYSFHKLVQDFFLYVQSEQNEGDKERKAFKIGFFHYFAEYWDSFHDSAYESKYDPHILAALDLERHNFELMETILPEFELDISYISRFISSAELIVTSFNFQSKLDYFRHLKSSKIDIPVESEVKRCYKVLLMLDCHSKAAISEKGAQRYMELFVELMLQISAFEDFRHGTTRALESLKSRKQRIIELYEEHRSSVVKAVEKYFEQMRKYSLEVQDIDTFMEAIQQKTRLTLPPNKCSAELECKESKKALSYFGVSDYDNALKHYRSYLAEPISDIEYLYTMVMIYYCYSFDGDQKSAIEVVQSLDSNKNRQKVNNLEVGENNIKKIHVLSLFYAKVRPGSDEHIKITSKLFDYLLNRLLLLEHLYSRLQITKRYAYIIEEHFN